MPKGRKAGVGTHEARILIINGQVQQAIENINCSNEAKKRLLKAVKFGLGIKDTQDKIEKPEKRIDNLKTKQQNPTSKIIDNGGDEYFTPENCYEVN